MRVRGALKVAALLTSLWASAAGAKNDEPNFHVTSRRNSPDFMNYFEESDVILFHDFREGSVYRSTDAGTKWERIAGVPEGEAARLVMHQFDSSRAYILTEGISHYRTHDRGKTWQQFVTDSQMSVFEYEVLNFHAGNPDHIIFNGMDCQSIFCDEVAMYTTDGFKSSAKFLRGNTAGCWWAKSSKLFETGDKQNDAQRILCIVRDALSPFKQDQRLLISDNFFSAEKADGVVQEFEPLLDTNRRVQGIVNLAVVKKYLLVATTSVNTDEMALFVTDDTAHWHRAIFPTDHRVNQEAYTVLESTSYSIQIDVMTTRPSNPMGVMFTSNSNGTFFTRNKEYTNRNTRGNVDFEKVSGIQGIFMVNKVENGAEVEKDPRAEKNIMTEITFDDGRTFEPVTAGKERIHLHSVTDIHNVGRIFSSPAPGLLMGVGNTGKYLGKYEDGDLYVSDDAGVTWAEALKGPHKYEFGDQGSILLAVKEGKEVGEISYSLDHGQKWKSASFPDGLKIKPFVLTTTQDSSSLKFILVGESTSDGRWQIISIDFDGLHEATCKESDMEEWWARATGKGDGTCLMGHTQKYHRRKKNSECFLKQEFKEPVVETNDCDCQDWDFECDYNFKKGGTDNKECVPAGPVALPEGACKTGKPDETFMGSKGWRLIPGNTCKRGKGEQKDAQKEYKCSESHAPPPPPATGKISQKVFEFQGSKFDAFEKYYLDRGFSSKDSEETVIARPYVKSTRDGGPIYITQDQGKTWTQPEAFKEDKFWAVVPHKYFKEMLFLVRNDGKVTYTVDYGKHWHDFSAPTPPDMDGRQSLMFHPDKKNWLIWLGDTCKAEGKNCRYVTASFSDDRGDNWKTLRRNVERCEFIGSSAYKYRNETEVLCLAKESEDADPDSPRQLVASNNFFHDDEETVRAKNVRDFATMDEFVIVATKNTEKQTLEALASVDGVTYVEAKFPYNFEVPHQRGYTVLDCSTHAVNLFVVTETTEKRKYGTLLKSNSNGTSYVMSIAGVNCNDEYYVDFEKMLGLEGVALVNTVTNPDDKKAEKKLQSRISHNDGAEWGYLPPPAKDVEGKDYPCSSSEGGDEKCALHIHGYTQREDHRKTYSSEGAVGIMFGLGNVGSHLGDYGEADTFMTTDAGISWKNVKKGVWTWQMGDQGSIIVLVQLRKGIKTVSYTTDEGRSWNDYQFSDTGVEVLDITTFRSGVSRNFMLWCRGPEGVFTINLDYSGLTDRACNAYDPKDPAGSDYNLWSPEHPKLKNSECLFGHKSRYLRKKTDKTCYNGHRMEHLYNQENCECSRRDYECDYNYELDNQGACGLVQGLSPQTKDQWCGEHPNTTDYYDPTGYRRLPLTTCVDGVQYDRLSEPQPCPNHEEEFARKHSGPGAAAIFFAVAIPIGIAAAVGSYVYRNWSGKFGTIRLGEQGSGPGGRFSLDNDSPWVRYPVLALSAAVAVIGAIPLVASALWRTATTAAERWGFGSGSGGGWTRLAGGGGGVGGGANRRFTTRDSFARGRGDYAIVDEDEGELLGEDSDEEAV